MEKGKRLFIATDITHAVSGAAKYAKARRTKPCADLLWHFHRDLEIADIVLGRHYDQFAKGEVSSVVHKELRKVRSKLIRLDKYSVEVYAREPSYRVHMCMPEVSAMLYVKFVEHFLVYVSDVMRMLGDKYPNMMTGKEEGEAVVGKGQAASVDLGRVFESSSLEALKQELIEERVDRLSRKGFQDILDWFGKKPRNVQLGLNKEQCEGLIQVIAVRNLIVHNRGVVDRAYLSAKGAAGYKRGDVLMLTTEDAYHCSDVIVTAVANMDEMLVKHQKLEVVDVAETYHQRFMERFEYVERSIFDSD